MAWKSNLDIAIKKWFLWFCNKAYYMYFKAKKKCQQLLLKM